MWPSTSPKIFVKALSLFLNLHFTICLTFASVSDLSDTSSVSTSYSSSHSTATVKSLETSSTETDQYNLTVNNIIQLSREEGFEDNEEIPFSEYFQGPRCQIALFAGPAVVRRIPN